MNVGIVRVCARARMVQSKPRLKWLEIDTLECGVLCSTAHISSLSHHIKFSVLPILA